MTITKQRYLTPNTSIIPMINQLLYAMNKLNTGKLQQNLLLAFANRCNSNYHEPKPGDEYIDDNGYFQIIQ